MQILQVHVQITSLSNPSMAARCPNGDLPMIAGFLDIRRRPAGPPAVTAGRPADRRRGIGRNLVILKVNRAATKQSPGGGQQTSGA